VPVGAAVVLASCGGQPGQRTVTGAGYSFRAPAGWEVVRSARGVRASEGGDGAAVIGVSRFPLLRAYRPALWSKVVRELDGASSAIARDQHGSVTDARDVRISGERARRYTLTYDVRGKKLVEELVFVLRAKTEYLLLCRYEQGGSLDACDTLMSSFRLT
jgi:hypothetical protein